ncbi:cytochrome P450 2J1 [Parasteatoda tepidariorum]|uniref:cytochrome P450 2J1 n=1 Tax=Parasteatoda tepidariorum TaxID=114398 RepID=UPI001C7230F8|nr:cytochrome P450 2J1-like [Parasteatoda tepidariorum]
MLLNIVPLSNTDLPVFIAVIAVVFSCIYYLLRNKGLPPGPIGIPYLGYWPYLDHDTGHLQLQELGKKYGDMYTLSVTGQLYLHLGSIKAVKEVHVANSDCFDSRLVDYNIISAYFKDGIVGIKGEAWKTLRKFFLGQFRERGMNVIKDSGCMYDIIRETIGDLKETKGKPVDIANIVLTKCNAIMRQTLLGGDGMSEKEMREFNENYFQALATMTAPTLLLSGNIAKYFIIPFTKGFSESRKQHFYMRDTLYKVLNRRRKTFDEANIRDCFDAFLKEKMDRKAKSDPTAKYFTDEAFVVSLIQIIGDGVYFMAIFIGAFIRVLLEHPEEQEKVYSELLEVVGESREPGMEDKSKLTYTNAFISEVMRTTDVFPLLVGLICNKETYVNGYRIPKGTTTIYNFWMAHMNPEDYEEPQKFNPSRFIVKDGKKKAELLPLFGIGKRSCMGEGFAMIQVFLFLTTIIKNFRLEKPSAGDESQSVFFNFDKLNVCAHFRSHK